MTIICYFVLQIKETFGDPITILNSSSECEESLKVSNKNYLAKYGHFNDKRLQTPSPRFQKMEFCKEINLGSQN